MKILDIEELDRRHSKEQLEFLVLFANLDVKHSTERDWTDLQKRFCGFFGGSEPSVLSQGTVIYQPADIEELQKYPRQKLEILQGELKALLCAIAAGRVNLGGGAISLQIDVKLSYSLVGIANGPDCLIASGRARDLFLQAAISLLLDRRRSSTIHLCPECKVKYFLRVKRQIYCGRLCVDRVNHRSWLKTPKGKQYLRKLKKKRKLVSVKV